MTIIVVFNDIFIVSTGLIIHGDATIDQFNLSVLNEFLVLFSFLKLSLVPPFLQKADFNLHESLSGVLFKLLKGSCDNIMDVALGDALGTTVEILIESFQPADIVVTMGNYEHIQIFTPREKKQDCKT